MKHTYELCVPSDTVMTVYGEAEQRDAALMILQRDEWTSYLQTYRRAVECLAVDNSRARKLLTTAQPNP